MLLRRTGPAGVACLLLIAAAVTGLIACGGDDEDESKGAGVKGNAAEKAFLSAMVAHHESALEMARVAVECVEDPFVKRMADQIASSQTREIAQMRGIHDRLFDRELRPDP